jgi:hypothetical protein
VISLMADDEARDQKLAALRGSRPKVIWALARAKSHDKRICVADESRFLAEINRLGVAAPEYRVVSENELPLEGIVQAVDE